jgi:hypothetical protein
LQSLLVEVPALALTIASLIASPTTDRDRYK